MKIKRCDVPTPQKRQLDDISTKYLPKIKKTVSVAPLFLQLPILSKPNNVFDAAPNQTNHGEQKKAVKRVSQAQEPEYPVKKVKVVSESPSKPIPNHQSESEHHFSTSFKETTHGLRKHLLLQETAEINRIFDDLINQLNDMNTAELLTRPTQANPTPTPVMVSLPFALAEMSKPLTAPFGSIEMTIKLLNKKGDVRKERINLARRFEMFEEMISEKEKELKALAGEWEDMVGEIMRIGLQVLGEERLRALLGYESVELQKSKVVEAIEVERVEKDDELTLIDDQPPTKPQKRVSFAPIPTPLPKFVNRRSIYKMPLQLMPSLPEKQVEEWKEKIKNCGTEQLKQLREDEKKAKKNNTDAMKKLVQFLAQSQ